MVPLNCLAARTSQSVLHIMFMLIVIGSAIDCFYSADALASRCLTNNMHLFSVILFSPHISESALMCMRLGSDNLFRLSRCTRLLVA